jgi:hypothetical protein
MRETEVGDYVRPEQIAERLKQLHPGAVVSRGHLETKVRGHILDGEWGVFDLIHRIHVHHTYPNFIPLISSKDISVLVTPWGKLPIFFQVVTARVGPAAYYQTFSIFGVLYCHQISQMVQMDDEIHVSMDWFLVSHWLFKWMHRLFDRRLARLQKDQGDEDAPLRDRRLDLRKRGVRFVTDEPDFINANDLSDHVILPSAELPLRLLLRQAADGSYRHISAGPIELLVKKEADELTVWPGLCPHEGAKLEEKNLCENRLTCPWHGRTFGATRLPKGGTAVFRYLGLIIERDGDDLVVKAG